MFPFSLQLRESKAVDTFGSGLWCHIVPWSNLMGSACWEEIPSVIVLYFSMGKSFTPSFLALLWILDSGERS